MFVILTYDVGVKRVSKVLKTCRKYLSHVQKSVFEGMISDGELNKLKKELVNIIKYEEDEISIYKLDNIKFTSKDTLGKEKLNNNIL